MIHKRALFGRFLLFSVLVNVVLCQDTRTLDCTTGSVCVGGNYLLNAAWVQDTGSTKFAVDCKAIGACLGTRIVIDSLITTTKIKCHDTTNACYQANFVLKNVAMTSSSVNLNCGNNIGDTACCQEQNITLIDSQLWIDCNRANVCNNMDVYLYGSTSSVTFFASNTYGSNGISVCVTVVPQSCQCAHSFLKKNHSIFHTRSFFRNRELRCSRLTPRKRLIMGLMCPRTRRRSLSTRQRRQRRRRSTRRRHRPRCQPGSRR